MTHKFYYPKGKKIPGTRLTPIGFRKHSGKLQCVCLCDCGNTTYPTPHDIGKRTKSCGCLRKETSTIRASKHGLDYTKEYQAAKNAFYRCTNKDHKLWPTYGGRGIKFNFSSIIEMAEWLIKNLPKPTDTKTFLDRIENDGHYEPGNLRWLSAQKSATNRRTTTNLTIKGKTLCFSEWGRLSGVHPTTLYWRVKKGIPEDLLLYKGQITKQLLFEHEYSKQS